MRQPALVRFMQSKVKEIWPEWRQQHLVKDVSEQLTGIEKLVSFPEDRIPTQEQVKKVNDAVSKLMKEIESKEPAK